MAAKILKERALEDDYPTHPGYLYVVILQDGTEKVVRNVAGRTVADFKQSAEQVIEVRNCDIEGRDLWHLLT